MPRRLLKRSANRGNFSLAVNLATLATHNTATLDIEVLVMNSSQSRDILNARSLVGLGEPPLRAYMSNYAPTWNPAIWNKDLWGFVDDDARMAMLRKFSTDIGKEIYTVQMDKSRRRGGGTQDELTEGVKTRLDKLDRNCTARHSGKDCPFVRTIKEYLDPSKRSDTTAVSKIRHLRHREITKVDMEVLIENHMSRFISSRDNAIDIDDMRTEDRRREGGTE
jgi:hypothetical protein